MGLFSFPYALNLSPSLSSLGVTASYGSRCPIRVLNNTNDAEADFGLKNGVWDYADIDSWLAGAVGKIKTYYDPVNGYHATQTAKANMSFYKSATYSPSGVPCGFFNQPNGVLDHFYNINIPLDSNDLKLLFVSQGWTSFFPGVASTDILFYAGGAPPLVTISDNGVFRGGTKSIQMQAADVYPIKNCNLSQVGLSLKSGVAASYFIDNMIAETFAPLTNRRQPTTAILGKRSNNQFKQMGIFHELVIYNSSLSTALENELKADQRHLYKI